MVDAFVLCLGLCNRLIKFFYERNRALVDLHAQPEAIVEELDQTIAQAKAENKNVDQVGIRFMRFCGKYDLNRISEQAQLYVEPFNARLGS